MSQVLRYSPEKPLPGTSLRIEFNPRGTVLEIAAKVYAVAYTNRGSRYPQAKEIPLAKENDIWSAQIEIDGKTRGLHLKFGDASTTEPTRSLQYSIPLYDPNGNRVPGNLAFQAEAYSLWGETLLGLKPDWDKAYSLFQEEFKTHPELKWEYLDAYFRSVHNAGKEDRKEIILKDLEAFEAEKGATQAELPFLERWYRIIGFPDKARKYARLRQPNQSLADEEERYQAILSARDAEAKFTLLESFRAEFPESRLTESLLLSVHQSLLARKNYSRGQKILDEFLKINSRLSWAWLGFARNLSNARVDLEKAGELACRGLEIAREDAARAEKASSSARIPSGYTEKEWADRRASTLIVPLTTYGEVLLRLERNEEACLALKEAFVLSRGRDERANEIYAQALVKTGDYPAAVDILARLARKAGGFGRLQIMDLYFEALVGAGQNEKALAEIETYVRAQGESPHRRRLFLEASRKLFADDEAATKAWARVSRLAQKTVEFRRSLLNDPLPLLSFQDSAGKAISLSEFAGRVAVLYFWSERETASLKPLSPLAAIAKERGGPEAAPIVSVRILDNPSEDREAGVRHLRDRGLVFPVHLNIAREALSDFGIVLPPAVIVLDPKGIIRYRKCDLDVPDEILAEDIGLMIDLAGRSDQILFPAAALQIPKKEIRTPDESAGPGTPWSIVPGVQVGPITNRTSESQIRALFGLENVRRQDIQLEEGASFPGTVVYPDDPEKTVIIRWRDPSFRNLPESVLFRGPRSIWKTDKGLSLGLTLKEIETINGKPFALYGFGWDYGGTVAGAEGGILAELGEKEHDSVAVRSLILRLSAEIFPTGPIPLTQDEYLKLTGERIFRSDHPGMQRLNPRVHEMIIMFPPPEIKRN
ncbi:MAG: TlpA disulfide reductase family protein [Candidatus Aminicenantes bacterium]|nr:TlpA disulfide reductase family protein [Candidatus Aminicenantes bacterium]